MKIICEFLGFRIEFLGFLRSRFFCFFFGFREVFFLEFLVFRRAIFEFLGICEALFRFDKCSNEFIEF